jgi:indole-3-acetate monooxygenase
MSTLTRPDWVELQTELTGRAHDLAALLRAEAATNDRIGRLSDTSVRALRDAELLQFCATTELGGMGASPVEALSVLEAVAIADGSAGWVAMVTNSLMMMLTYLEPAAAERLCANGLPFIAGQGAPSGNARRTEGGYRVSGRWSYASAFQLADYVMASCMVTDESEDAISGADDSPARMMIFLVPADVVAPAGNWDVLGLRATGSVDYSVTDVVVPADQGIDVLGAPRFGGTYAMIGFPNWAVLGHTAAALGIARHALDAVADFARKPKGPFPIAAKTESMQTAYGRAEATLRGARALAYEAWADAEATAECAEPLSTRQQTLLRLSLLHVTNAAQEVVSWAYRCAGGTALREGELQRCMRDIHAATQHVFVGDSFYQHCGQDLLNVAENKTWTLLGLA